MDRLTVEELDVWKHEAKLPFVRQLAEQLADTLRENEQLRAMVGKPRTIGEARFLKSISNKDT